jgi:hypothetical protein
MPTLQFNLFIFFVLMFQISYNFLVSDDIHYNGRELKNKFSSQTRLNLIASPQS